MLSQLLSAETFAFMLVFARLGSAVMLLPGFGEAFVYARVRLGLALALTVIVFPLVRGSLPAVPDDAGLFVLLIAGEVVHGLFIGGIARTTFAALHTAGAVMAYQSGLAFAQTVDPAQGGQSALLSSFMTMLGIVLIFTTGLHMEMIGAVYDSYTLFPPGGAVPFDDFADFATKVVAGAFRIALHLAAPFIVFGLVFYIGLGMLQRLIPQVQLFFIAMPLQMVMAFLLLSIVVAGTMIWFLDYYAEVLRGLRAPG